MFYLPTNLKRDFCDFRYSTFRCFRKIAKQIPVSVVVQTHKVLNKFVHVFCRVKTVSIHYWKIFVKQSL